MTKDAKNIFIHDSSYIDDNVKIGNGTKIWHFCHVLANSNIGENCSFGQNVVAGPNVNIGNNVKVQNNVSIYDGITIEDDVFCGPSCVFTNVNNPRSEVNRKNEFEKTVVKKTGGELTEILMWLECHQAFFCKIGNDNFYIIGSGSNLLIRDNGYDGTLIKLGKRNFLKG